jgi:hypothetical protein
MRLLISGSPTSPVVLFDLSASFLRITGVSTMPDASVFYGELAQWLSAHASHIQPGTELVLSLQFLNSASIRALYVFLRTIKERQFPLRIVIIHQGRSDNEDVVEFLVEACRLLGLGCEVREEP